MESFKGLLFTAMLTFGVNLAAHCAVTSYLQSAIRGSTFEVVMKKPDTDPITYEKPLPLDLLPFYERNDAYRSVGTAFALGNNTFVTAAHVLIAGVGSQFGAPALRRSDGTVLLIDRIVKFSLHEDFVEFSLRADPGARGFSVNREPKIDEPVFAVGNALGEGIVIRDGLFTSETPEDQDGRWKWIRFSAAASPGNSGGPLLDGNGRVIGIVIGKSANENLNYSLPIGRLLDADERTAQFEQRGLIRLPYLHGTSTYQYQDHFALPLSWAAFVEAYTTLIDRHDAEGRSVLLKTYADSLFPKGPGIEDLLYDPDANEFRPRLIVQQDDGRWTAPKADFRVVKLPGDGSISVANVAGAALFRLVRPDGDASDAFYHNSKAFMDLALKGLAMRRPVGLDQITIISLGAARSDTVLVDSFGRKWQKRIWAMPFQDAYLVGFLLPVPDGYVGAIVYAPSQRLREAGEQAQLLTNQIDVSYHGTLTQWWASLKRRDLLPKALMDVKLDSKAPWNLQTPRFTTHLPPEVLPLTDKSPLDMVMGFMVDGLGTSWGIQEIWWSKDDRGDTAVGLWRRARPPTNAALELRNKFTSMREHRSPFDGALNRDTAETYSATAIKEVPGRVAGKLSSDLLYGLTTRLTGHPTMQDAGQALNSFSTATRLLEPGLGEDVPQTTPAPSALEQSFEQYQRDLLTGAAAAEQAEGTDIRGRVLGDDLKRYLEVLKKEVMSTPLDGLGAARSDAEQSQRMQMLREYWNLYPALSRNRSIWQEFLVRNRLSAVTPHVQAVTVAENALLTALNEPVPSREWADQGRRLLRAYIDERNILVKTALLAPHLFQNRTSACTAPAANTSGRRTVKLSRSPRSAEDFWPVDSKRRGEEGTVLIALKVSATGCATAGAIVGSSGFDALDNAVLQFYETLEFLPGEIDGKATETTATIPVVFKLTDSAPSER